jgi:RNA polymerase sigma-70 factor (ECF subfamily)
MHSTHPPDESLARQAVSSPAAFAELYRRHAARIYRYHLACAGAEADAQDLTTQTFLAALEGLAGFRGEAGFAAWLMGIARRIAAGFFRRRRPETPLETAPELPDPAPTPETSAARRQTAERLAQALRSLTPERAEAIRLVIFGELSAAEAGEAMGRSPAAVKMLLYRGLEDLRRRFPPHLLEEL